MVLKLLLSLLVSNSIDVNAQSAENFVVEKVYPCEVKITNQKVNLTYTPKTFTQPQIFNVALMTVIPLGNQLKISGVTELENTFFDNGWQHLFSVEDDFCRVLYVYGGPFVHDIETAMGIPIGVCPIPKGNYHAVNFTADFGKLRLQTFPFGKIRITVKFVEKRGHRLLACSTTVLSNIG